MSQGTKFALSLVLLMAAMVALFVAFHPNSIQPGDGQSWASALFESFQKDLNKGTQPGNAPSNATAGGNSTP